MSSLFFSSPTEVVEAAARQVESGTIWGHLRTSGLHLVLGLLLAAVVGVAIGFAAGWIPRFNYILDPWITALYATPKVALIPLIILVLGIDLAPKVFVVFLLSVFYIIVNTIAGVQVARRGPLLDVARTFGASRMLVWRSVVIPSAAPFIMTGLRLSVGHGLVGVIVAEFIAGNEGLGYMIRFAGNTFQTSTVIFGIVLIGVWGVISMEVLSRIERRFELWRPVKDA